MHALAVVRERVEEAQQHPRVARHGPGDVAQGHDRRGTGAPAPPPQRQVVASPAKRRAHRALDVELRPAGHGPPTPREELPRRKAEPLDHAAGLAELGGRHLLEILRAEHLRVGERHPDRLGLLLLGPARRPGLGIERLQDPAVGPASAWAAGESAARQELLEDPVDRPVGLAPEEAEGLPERVAVLASLHPHGVERPVELVPVGRVDAREGVEPVEDLARAERQTGGAQEPPEAHDALGERQGVGRGHPGHPTRAKPPARGERRPAGREPRLPARARGRPRT